MCLIPEVPFALKGPSGLCAYVEALLEKKGHAVVCVAEGAGQDLLDAEDDGSGTDASGNPVLKGCVGCGVACGGLLCVGGVVWVWVGVGAATRCSRCVSACV